MAERKGRQAHRTATPTTGHDEVAGRVMDQSGDPKTASSSPKAKRSSRRIIFTALGALAGLGVLEAASLQGWFDFRKLPKSLTKADAYRASLARLKLPEQANGQIVHVGHSTHLICVAGTRMLTDPWFYDPAFGALSHAVGPAVSPQEIGPLDCILVSHDHADHFDRRAVDQLDKSAIAIVATEALAARARALGFKKTHVLRAYEEMTVGRATVIAVPGIHDIYEVGYVVRGAGRSVYFAGDTRYQDAFAEIAERYAPQTAILPVDGTRLRGGDLHVMTPQDAVRAAAVLGASIVMPTHAEAVFSDVLVDGFLATTIAGAPAKFGALVQSDLPGVHCELPLPGESFTLPPAQA